MPNGLDFSCEDGQCTWQWDANQYPVEEITIRVRNRDGGSELRKIPNTGSLVLPEEDQIMEIDTPVEGEGRHRRRPDQWRGPG
jgi:hypothetical protein